MGSRGGGQGVLGSRIVGAVSGLARASSNGDPLGDNLNVSVRVHNVALLVGVAVGVEGNSLLGQGQGGKSGDGLLVEHGDERSRCLGSWV
ncbi:hypothetical protein HYQ46_002287 [Verticillium longisporum]|nr:hypothetical protein HYQ46_002287 [Verticillium longisporum]